MGEKVYLGRHTLTDLLTEVAEILQRQRVVAQVYVVDGAAMALGYDSERYTVDVDALVLDGYDHLIKAVHEVARRRGLLTSWFNEQAVPFISKVRDTRPLVVFDHPALRVFAASPEHLLAMKILASRPGDLKDIRTLLGILGITTSAEAVEVVGRYFPLEDLNERTRMVVNDIFTSSEK